MMYIVDIDIDVCFELDKLHCLADQFGFILKHRLSGFDDQVRHHFDNCSCFLKNKNTCLYMEGNVTFKESET